MEVAPTQDYQLGSKGNSMLRAFSDVGGMDCYDSDTPEPASLLAINRNISSRKEV